jgi:hypothetical protein
MKFEISHCNNKTWERVIRCLQGTETTSIHTAFPGNASSKLFNPGSVLTAFLITNETTPPKRYEIPRSRKQKQKNTGHRQQAETYGFPIYLLSIKNPGTNYGYGNQN